jgi:hypothetical protein
MANRPSRCLARHYATHLRAENRARAIRGETPQALDGALSEALKIDPARPVYNRRTGLISI